MPRPGPPHPAALTSPYINAANSDAQGPPLPVPSPEADPAPKRRPAKRKTPEAAPDITLDSELLRQGNPKGQQVPLPSSLTDKVFKAWLHERTLSNQATYLDLIKQELASDTVEPLKNPCSQVGRHNLLSEQGIEASTLAVYHGSVHVWQVRREAVALTKKDVSTL